MDGAPRRFWRVKGGPPASRQERAKAARITVRPSNHQASLLKIKTLPRWLVGNPAHARASCALTIHDPRQRACSHRHRQPREVALQQPKVAAQLPAGGDVSYPCPCVAWTFFARRAEDARWSRRSSKLPRKNGWLHSNLNSHEADYFPCIKKRILASALEIRTIEVPPTCPFGSDPVTVQTPPSSSAMYGLSA